MNPQDYPKDQPAWGETMAEFRARVSRNASSSNTPMRGSTNQSPASRQHRNDTPNTKSTPNPKAAEKKKKRVWSKMKMNRFQMKDSFHARKFRKTLVSRSPLISKKLSFNLRATHVRRQ